MADDPKQNPDSPREVYRLPPDARIWSEVSESRTSATQIVSVLLRQRRKVVGSVVAVALTVVLVSLLLPPTYTSTASLAPQSGGGMGGQLSQLSGVATQFGINVPDVQAGQSPQFYADLITSRRLLEEAVSSEYTWQGSHEDQRGADSASVTLVEIYGIEESTRGKAVYEATERLRDEVDVAANPETGVVNLSVTTSWPEVSEQIAERLIELVNRFNNRVRQTQAAAEAEFVDGRLQKARRELRAAEDSLQAFLEQNVGWQQSPNLRFRHDRLQRMVSLKQQVYNSLASRYEEARISEVKSTPVVTTVTDPQAPVRPDSSHLLLRAALGLVVGTIVGVTWAFGSEYARYLREERADDYRELRTLSEDAAEDIRKVGRRIRGLMGGSSS